MVKEKSNYTKFNLIIYNYLEILILLWLRRMKDFRTPFFLIQEKKEEK